MTDPIRRDEAAISGGEPPLPLSETVCGEPVASDPAESRETGTQSPGAAEPAAEAEVPAKASGTAAPQTRKKKEKTIYIDDGSVIADMDLEGFPWHGRSKQKKKAKADRDRPTFREKLAIILGVYRAFLPALLVALGMLALMFLLGYFWMR